MRRSIPAIAGVVGAVTLSAAVALAGGGNSGVATGHGQAISEVAQAVDTVGGNSHGKEVSALAKQHGALVSAAARAQHGNKENAGKDDAGKGQDKAREGSDDDAAETAAAESPALTDDNSSEPGGIKEHGNGQGQGKPDKSAVPEDSAAPAST